MCAIIDQAMKKRAVCLLCAILAAIGILFAVPQNSYADPVIEPETTVISPEETPTENPEEPAETTEEEEGVYTTDATCYDQVGAIGWLVCPTTGVLAKGIDAIYGIIEGFLQVSPISTDTDSPIYLVWEYVRNITNIIFIIFLLVVIYSQVTGFGITNYGIKKVLPRIVIAAILVNLSYIICALAVDVSNILGSSLGGVFTGIQEVATSGELANYSFGDIAGTILGTAAAGTAITIGGLAIAGGGVAALWMLLPVVLAGIIAVITALIMLAARQALIIILIMIAPLAFVAYLLPNTEKWFKKWKDILLQMLIFYPMFSVLFGASQLASWVIISSSTNVFGIILGIAVQIIPLFFAFSLMKMSNTILGSISAGIGKLAARPQAGVKAWSDTYRSAAKAKHLANNRMPSARLSNYLSYRKQRTEEMAEKNSSTVASRNSLLIAASAAGHKAKWNSKTKSYDVTERTRKNPTKAALANKNANITAKEAENAQLRLSNYTEQLGSYHPNNKAVNALGNRAYSAFEESYIQGSLAENIERKDTEELLNKVFDARKAVTEKAQLSNPDKFKLEDYKRIIKRSAGMLGEPYEETIMQKVLEQQASIEARDRKRMRIAQNKFADSTPFYKFEYRAFTLGHYVDDSGNFTDENGNPSDVMVKYKRTDDRGMRYLDLEDLDHNTIYRMYEDNSPLLKETFIDNIAIGDAVNKKFIVAAADGNSLRKYNAAITNALLDSRFKENAPWFGSMFASYIRQGHINTDGKLALAALDSIKKTGKPGALLTGDSWYVEDMLNYMNALYSDDPAEFEKVFKKSDIDEFTTINGDHLDGATTEEKISNLKKDLGAKAYGKIFDALLGARGSKVLDGQKQSTREKFAKLLELQPEIKKYNPEAFDKIMTAYDLSLLARDIRDGGGKGQKKGPTPTEDIDPESIYNKSRYSNPNYGVQSKIEDYFMDSFINYEDPDEREDLYSDILDIISEHHSMRNNEAFKSALYDTITNIDLSQTEVQDEIDRLLYSFFSDAPRPDEDD